MLKLVPCGIPTCPIPLTYQVFNPCLSLVAVAFALLVAFALQLNSRLSMFFKRVFLTELLLFFLGYNSFDFGFNSLSLVTVAECICLRCMGISIGLGSHPVWDAYSWCSLRNPTVFLVSNPSDLLGF